MANQHGNSIGITDQEARKLLAQLREINRRSFREEISFEQRVHMHNALVPELGKLEDNRMVQKKKSKGSKKPEYYQKVYIPRVYRCPAL